MKRIMMSLLCIVFVMAGCQGNTDDKIGEKEGVYYPKISDREVSNQYSGGLYTYCTLYYGGRIYNSIEGNYTEVKSTLDKSELNLDEILGDELGSIFGNNGIYWSTDKEKLYEVTHEGTLYKVKGYDDEFRVCVYYETIYDFPQGEEHFYHLEVFECLNDITLDKGSELFKDYFHLENAVELKAISEEKSCQLSVENSTVQAFLKALNSGDFIASEDEKYPTFDGSKRCTLIFIDNFGFKKAIGVYDKGYVTTKSQEGYIMVIKVDKEICKAIINMVNDLSLNSTGGNETTTNNNEAFSESLKKITLVELKRIATSEGFNWNTLSSVYNLKKEYIDVSDVVYYEAYVEHNGTSFKLHAQQGAGDKKDSEDVSYVYLQNEKTCKILVLYDTDEDFIVTEEMIDEFVNREESISSYFTIDVPEGYKLGRFRVGLEGMFEGCLLYKEGEEEATYTKYSERHGGVFVCNDETEVFRYEDGSLSGIKYSAINNTLEPQGGFESIELLDGGQALIGRCELREYNDSLEYEKTEFWYIFIDCDMDKNCYMLYFNPNDFTREDVIETAKTVVFAE